MVQNLAELDGRPGALVRPSEFIWRNLRHHVDRLAGFPMVQKMPACMMAL